MYNGLTDIDQRGNLVPSLAESWEPNQELTAWTFRLRKGVLFHNGREFDAEAVKLNILRIQDPAIGARLYTRRAGKRRQRRGPRQVHGPHQCQSAGCGAANRVSCATRLS